MIKNEKQKIAEHFGEAVQMQQLVEEMSELTKAICKYARVNGIGQPVADSVTEETVEANLVEELADVKLVLEQVIYLHGCKEGVENVIAEKIVKVNERIQKSRTDDKNWFSETEKAEAEKVAKIIERIRKDRLSSETENADIVDVANFFLLKQPMFHQKLQKLCYYAEAWSEALLGQPIAEKAEFQAWVNGPENVVLYELFNKCGWNQIFVDDHVAKHIGKVFSEEQLGLLENVWETYGDSTGTALEALTQRELPWIEARGNAKIFEHCTTPINTETMAKYYKSICQENE